MNRSLKTATFLLVSSILCLLISKFAVIPLALSVYSIVKNISEKTDSSKISKIDIIIIIMLILCVISTFVLLSVSWSEVIEELRSQNIK